MQQLQSTSKIQITAYSNKKIPELSNCAITKVPKFGNKSQNQDSAQKSNSSKERLKQKRPIQQNERLTFGKENNTGEQQNQQQAELKQESQHFILNAGEKHNTIKFQETTIKKVNQKSALLSNSKNQTQRNNTFESEKSAPPSSKSGFKYKIQKNISAREIKKLQPSQSTKKLITVFSKDKDKDNKQTHTQLSNSQVEQLQQQKRKEKSRTKQVKINNLNKEINLLLQNPFQKALTPKCENIKCDTPEFRCLSPSPQGKESEFEENLTKQIRKFSKTRNEQKEIEPSKSNQNISDSQRNTKSKLIKISNYSHQRAIYKTKNYNPLRITKHFEKGKIQTIGKLTKSIINVQNLNSVRRSQSVQKSAKFNTKEIKVDSFIQKSLRKSLQSQIKEKEELKDGINLKSLTEIPNQQKQKLIQKQRNVTETSKAQNQEIQIGMKTQKIQVQEQQRKKSNQKVQKNDSKSKVVTSPKHKKKKIPLITCNLVDLPESNSEFLYQVSKIFTEVDSPQTYTYEPLLQNPQGSEQKQPIQNSSIKNNFEFDAQLELQHRNTLYSLQQSLKIAKPGKNKLNEDDQQRQGKEKLGKQKRSNNPLQKSVKCSQMLGAENLFRCQNKFQVKKQLTLDQQMLLKERLQQAEVRKSQELNKNLQFKSLQSYNKLQSPNDSLIKSPEDSFTRFTNQQEIQALQIAPVISFQEITPGDSEESLYEEQIMMELNSFDAANNYEAALQFDEKSFNKDKDQKSSKLMNNFQINKDKLLKDVQYNISLNKQEKHQNATDFRLNNKQRKIEFTIKY